MAVTPTSINPLANFNIASLGTFANIGIVLALSVMVVFIGGLIAYFYIISKSYNLKIHVFQKVGNLPTRVSIFKAKAQPFGMAGDRLWRVAPAGLGVAFKIIKWLPVGKYQTAPHEFWYWIREDGEWINFTPTDIDEESKKMKIKFVQEDMRLQRLATEKLLEQRLMNKSFWEKYGLVLGYIIFFLVITIAMIIIFYQWSKIVEQIAGLVNQLTIAIEVAQKGQMGGLVPT